MKINKKRKPELLAPAGNWKMISAGVQSGADAVYLGIDKLNMRAKANNFKLDELPEIVEYCHNNNVDVHLTLNSIVYESELPELDEILIKVKKAGVDMIICWDHSVIKKCKEHDIPFCVSTQASISNSSAAAFYKELGAKRIVLARECSLEQIKEIKGKSGIEIEAFIHGAMCIAVSGRCFMSHHIFDKSANRGECIQPCRREYEIYDRASGKSMLLGEDYVLSPNDLNTIEFIDLLIDAGIDSFKIEGRKRSPEYIASVVSIYREAIDLYAEGKLDKNIKSEMFRKLGEVYNRGFSSGFYFERPSSEDYASHYGNIATTKKIYAGKVINYFKKSKIAHIKLEAEKVNTGDHLYIIGDTTGVVKLELGSLEQDEKKITEAQKGDEVTFECETLVRPRDKVYKIVPAANKLK